MEGQISGVMLVTLFVELLRLEYPARVPVLSWKILLIDAKYLADTGIP